MFTLGNGDLSPGDGLWQVATVAATGTGLVLVTLAITYLVPVASAASQRRQLASYIHSLGDAPADALVRAWTGGGFGSLGQHLVALTPLLEGARQNHLTYPMLHHFHATEVASAAPPAIASLSATVHLLRHGVAEHLRDASATEPLDGAIGSLLETLATADMPTATGDPLPLPSLEPLRAVGIPTVADEDYEDSARTSLERRTRLAAFLAGDGWRPEVLGGARIPGRPPGPE